jgi:hypothetical protein
MYRRHFVAVMLAVTVALLTSTVAAAEAPSSVSHPNATASTAPSKAILAAITEPVIPTPITTLSPVVAAQDARSYLTQQANQRRLVEYAALAASQRQAAIHLQLVSELNTAEQVVQNSMFQCIRNAESGGRYGITSGAYGILISTWNSFSSVWSPFGSWAVPGDAPAQIQDLVAYHLYEVGGGYGGWNDSCTGR